MLSYTYTHINNRTKIVTRKMILVSSDLQKPPSQTHRLLLVCQGLSAAIDTEYDCLVCCCSVLHNVICVNDCNPSRFI